MRMSGFALQYLLVKVKIHLQVIHLQMALKSLHNKIAFKGPGRPDFTLDLCVPKSGIWLPTYNKMDNAYWFYKVSFSPIRALGREC